MHKQERKSYSLQCYNPDFTCQHYDEDGDEYYEQDPGCLVSGHSHAVSCLSFKPDDPNILVSGSFDKTLKIWDLSRAACLSTVNVDSAVRSVAYSPSGDTVAVGCHRGKVLLVDTLTGQVMLSLRGHNGRDDCICHFDVLGRLVGAVNPQCPVSGHSDW